MASSSEEKYDVFLNFRGKDTRKGFISHLYAALRKKNIRIFLDDEETETGDTLSPTLLTAIEGSKISITVFSEDYCSSTWCLDELVKIIECKNTRGQIVIPVFYNIVPAEVRWQIGKYRDAFGQHEIRNQFKVQKWKRTLNEAANIVGWDSAETRVESELVEKIVEDVWQKLNYIIDPYPSGFVGIDKRVAKVESLLCIGSNDVSIVGIWGVRLVGKTTIANALFRKHCSQFQGYCFLENVREEWKKHGGDDLRKMLLTQILGDKSCSNMDSTFIEDRLCRKRILIVFDDVSEPQQVEYLLGKKNGYGSGSKIIVTSKDRNVLQNEYDGLFEVKPLDTDEAHQLFCTNAFNQVQPRKEFTYLIRELVDLSGCIPLAVKVLGSYFYCKNTDAWHGGLSFLRRFLPETNHNVLMLVFSQLNWDELDVFLKVSVILKGEKKWRVTRLLDGCGFYIDRAMRALQNKSFIIVKNDQTIWMHDLIQEMGREIICKKRPELRSHLWDPEDIYNVLCCETGTDHFVEAESISLNMSEIKEISISPTAFARMQNLRLLKFYLPDGERRCNVHTPEGIEAIPAQLHYLRWDCFPMKALPASLNAEKLVELDLRHSDIVKLWDGIQDLAKLKSLYLSSCKCLLELPDLSTAENLEELHLDFCTSLCEVPSYILSLDHLLALNLEGCTKLQSIKSNMRSRSLRWLNLRACSKLAEFSVTSEKLEYLSLKGTAIEDFPSSVWQAKNVSCLYFSGCLRLEKLPPIFGASLSITSLFLNGCSSLSELPDNLNLLSALENLSVQGSCIDALPASIKHLSQLRSLDLSHCKRLRALPELPLLLQHLNAKGCTSLETVSSSGAATLIQNSFGSQNRRLLLRHHQELKMSLCHFPFSDVFEFNHCRRLDENAYKIIVGEAISRIHYAAYFSLLAQKYADAYHQFLLFSKDSDAETLEFTCRQLCVRTLGGDVPDWFWLQEIESSSLMIKINANCCTHCERSAFAFGIFQTNEEGDAHLKFGGRHRICVKQMFESPLRLFEKFWYNDVRVCWPGSRIPSCFRYRQRDQAVVGIELPRSSDLLGFAFCVISSHFPSIDKDCFPMTRCEWYFDRAERIGPYQSGYCYSCDLEWELISNSAFLWYDVKTSNSILEAIKESSDIDQSTSMTCNPTLLFKFYSKSGIKECGVWPINAADIESLRLLLRDPGSDLKCKGASTRGIENQEVLQHQQRKKLKTCSFHSLP